MTRTLMVGEPSAENRRIYELVYTAQQTALDALEYEVANGGRANGREIDRVSREVIIDAGHGDHYGHGLGHGIGLATHEMPSLGKNAPETPLPSPTVFSVEPGTYLDGVTGVRIEDLVVYDASQRKLQRLTMFPREMTVVG
jgi:Xaa-Pro aminopeptidase